MKLLGVADSDSYLKWSAATLDRLPAAWASAQVIVDSPVRPSPAQIRAAAGVRCVPVVSYRALITRIRRERPDAVLLACTGPVVAVLTAALRGPDRPVLITGLPGIAYPPSSTALANRSGCDLFLVHSHRELAAFRALIDPSTGSGHDIANGPLIDPSTSSGHEVDNGPARKSRPEPVEGPPRPGQLGLTTLPFLAESSGKAFDPAGPVIFAAQAAVPSARAERTAIVEALAALPDAVIKIRATAGERQTHDEAIPYSELAEPGTIAFNSGPMSEALAGARGLVTVSSTAALEAMALGVPTMIISDFGVSAELINQVFADSGCLAPLSELAAGGLRQPSPDWLIDNYFHPATDNDWLDRLNALVEQRRVSGLPIRRPAPAPPLTRLRRRLRLTAPLPGRISRRDRRPPR